MGRGWRKGAEAERDNEGQAMATINGRRWRKGWGKRVRKWAGAVEAMAKIRGTGWRKLGGGEGEDKWEALAKRMREMKAKMRLRRVRKWEGAEGENEREARANMGGGRWRK
jgi:hypothetical protein